MVDQCLACHTDLVQDPNNFHKIMLTQSKITGCNGCHTEHGGPAAPLTVIDLKTFPHDQTGYSLLAHQTRADGSPSQCADCHEHGYVGFDAAVCTTCHASLDAVFMQGHIATFGQNCLACHDGKDTYGKNFDHQQAAFKLTGKHTSAGCNQCHLQAQTIAALKDTPQGCYACHAREDAHNGLFGQDCSQCHTTSGWQPATFDHSKSIFPLTGAHLNAACSQCHTQGSSGAGLAKAPTVCFDCHAKDDAHQGKFGQDCSVCHSTTAWKPPTFDHTTSAFPLDGAHAKAACAQCHPQGFSTAGTPSGCFDCHAKDDAHQGLFGQDCAQCHTTDAWQPSTFDHSKFVFQLTGAHIKVPCTGCHTQASSVAGLASTPAMCNDCHSKDDPHQGQFGQDCSLCHSTAAWQPATFDHAKSAFPLTGAHTTVACKDCHTQGFSSAAIAAMPTTCSGCHAKDDAHLGQFGQDCAQCHTPAAWKPASFDHSNSNFPLTGGHLRVACSQCHLQGPNGTIYKGTPTVCISCHTDPAYHLGMFGTDCASCHTTTAYSPAKFNGPHTFPINHGEGGKNQCKACHPDSLTTYTCYTCHDQAGTVRRHENATAASIADCVRCHPTGRSGD